MSADTFTMKIWGARGGLASPSRQCERYGSNTSCVEVTCGDHKIILDAGSGMRFLGNRLIREDTKKIDLFFTHCHHDHVAGMPFFAPFYRSKYKINIWSGHLRGKGQTKKIVEGYMREPFFPVGPEVFSAKIQYEDFDPGDVLKPCSGVKIKTLELNHPGGCVGYRIEYKGRALCYITDYAHTPGEIDQPLRDFVRNADMMIYDASYTDREFPDFASFGHSTWEEGLRICEDENVSRYCIFHHRPSRTDKALDKILARARKRLKRTYAAYEGLVIKL